MTRNTFDMSTEARIILELLLTKEIGEIVAYSHLAVAIRSNNVGSNTSALKTAMRRAMNDHGRVFGVVRGAGVMRLADEQVVDESSANKRRLFRAGRRYAKRLGKVANFAALPREKQLQHSINATIFSAISRAASSHAEMRMAHVADTSPGERGKAYKSIIADTIAGMKRTER